MDSVRKTTVEGFDFDGTLFITDQAHKYGWQKALSEIEVTVDFTKLKNNSGLTTKQTAKEIIQFGSSDKHYAIASQNDLVDKLSSLKVKYMLEAPLKDISEITDMTAILRSSCNIDIIISNNAFAFVHKTLIDYRLMQYVDFIVCEDYGFDVKHNKKVMLSKETKPEPELFFEASSKLNIPLPTIFYGDKDEIDGVFARKINCKFTKVITNVSKK
jgi:beta-phosphoglucomutase-like phosphatase (HAD superfamily)